MINKRSSFRQVSRLSRQKSDDMEVTKRNFPDFDGRETDTTRSQRKLLANEAKKSQGKKGTLIIYSSSPSLKLRQVNEA